MLRLVLFFCAFFFASFHPSEGNYNDITIMGPVTPLFYLENALSGNVRTSEDVLVDIEVNNIIVESDRILVRIFMTNLPDNFKQKVTDDSRLYGSYLPLAEVVLENGTFLTPSSSSRYSLLEYNGKLIVGARLVFLTDQTPQTFYLNINQLPFDTTPLSEGLAIPIILKETEKTPAQAQSSVEISDISNGLEFLLSATAQTSEMTMIQPAVHMERADEILSKFGWITIRDPFDGKRFLTTRGNLYGFNLSDDILYSPGHAYAFSPIVREEPLEITMDHAYVVRSYDPAPAAELKFTEDDQTVLLQDEEFTLSVTETLFDQNEERIRIFIDSADKKIADLSFKFPEVTGVIKPTSVCGIDTGSGRLACDIYLHDVSLPSDRIRIETDAIEYYKEGPWKITWTPAAMETTKLPENPNLYYGFQSDYVPDLKKDQPEEVTDVFGKISVRSELLTSGPGWIHESFETEYHLSNDKVRTLIQADQYDSYFTHYITENWFHINDKSEISEKITVIRDAGKGGIFSAQIQSPDSYTDILHSLKIQNNQHFNTQYTAFEEFTNITESSAMFISSEKCDNNDSQCITFLHSLTGDPDSPESQTIIFHFDPENHFLRSEEIIYKGADMKMTRKTAALEKIDELPEDITLLVNSVK